MAVLIFPYVSEGSSSKRQTSFRKEPLPSCPLETGDFFSFSACSSRPAELRFSSWRFLFLFFRGKKKKKERKGFEPFPSPAASVLLKAWDYFWLFFLCSAVLPAEPLCWNALSEHGSSSKCSGLSTGAPPNSPSQHRSSSGHGDSCCLPLRATKGSAGETIQVISFWAKQKKFCQLTHEICGHGKSVLGLLFF